MSASVTADVVRVARSWIGTPYLHQASMKGAGCDCLGLVRGVWREIHGREPRPVPAYSPDFSEPQRVERLWAEARVHMRQKGDWEADEPGELLLFRMRRGGVAKHLGIAAELGARPSFIHAYSGRGVVESPLTQPWRRRIVARFDFDGKAH